MDPRHEREGDSESRDPDLERKAPVRPDESEAVPEFERGPDLDRGQEEQGERQSER